MTQANLITPAELPQYGAPSEWLAQFQPRPLAVQIITGGILGVMSFQWKRQEQDDNTWSATIISEAGASSQFDLPDPGYGSLIFGAGSYSPTTSYVVGSTGIVTPGIGALNALTATRFDPRLVACTTATKKACTWMQPRIVGPVLSVGEDIKEWLAHTAIFSLLSRNGFAPASAEAGADDNRRANAESAKRELKAIGAASERPADLVDSSTSQQGAGLNAYPLGDDLAGW